MATISLFVTTDYIKQTTGVNDSVGGDKMRSTIIDVQRRYIEPILGTDLFNSINTKIANSTLTGNYQTLVNDWIAPALCWYVYAELIPEIAVRLDRGGVFVNNAENAQAGTKSDRDYLQGKQLKKADWYAQRLVDYLCSNSTLFPEYSTNSDEDIYPIKPSPFNVFGLDGSEDLRREREKWGYGRS